MPAPKPATAKLAAMLEAAEKKLERIRTARDAAQFRATELIQRYDHQQDLVNGLSASLESIRKLGVVTAAVAAAAEDRP